MSLFQRFFMLLALLLAVAIGHLGCSNPADGDGDGDSDGDCDPADTPCEHDTDCCDGLSCHIVDFDTRETLCYVCQEEGEGCNLSTECCPGNVCVEHRCVSSCPRQYEIRVESAGVYARAEGGYYWDHEFEDDPIEREPDPYVRFTIGDHVMETPAIDNELNPIWFYGEVFDLECRSNYAVQMFDEDGDDDQLIMEFSSDFMFWLSDWDYRQGGVRIGGGVPGLEHTMVFSILRYAPVLTARPQDRTLRIHVRKPTKGRDS